MTLSAVLAVFTLFGLWALWTRRDQYKNNAYVLSLLAAFGFLYFVSTTQPHGDLRYLLLGPWYQDPNRLGIFLLIPSMLVAIAGFSFLWVKITGVARPMWRNTALVALVLFAIVGWAGPNTVQLLRSVKPVFAFDQASRLVSTDEFKLLERVGDNVPESDVIVGSPWQGAGMAYAFADREVVAPHLVLARDADVDLILDELNTAEPGSRVCDALEKKHVRFVLDFPGEPVYDKDETYAGLQNLEDSDAVTLVDHEGSAKLFEITGCE